jgi:hypothetical protein
MALPSEFVPASYLGAHFRQISPESWKCFKCFRHYFTTRTQEDPMRVDGGRSG